MLSHTVLAMTELEDGTIERPTAYAADVAAKIRATMAVQKVSSNKLAGKLGCSARWLQRRVSGEAELTLNDVEWIALGLDVPLSDLLVA